MGDLINSIGALVGISPNNAMFQAQKAQNVFNPFDAGTAQQGLQAGQEGLAAQQNLMNQLSGQGGLQNQANVFNQLQNVATGQGPNPAQAMLNQATGQNVANQAALGASQRGAGANPALLARQVGMAGSNAQQQAAGQGATLQANQQLGALGQLGGLANQQVANQIAGTQGYGQLAQNQQAQLINALMGQNAQNIGEQQGINQTNQAMAATNANNTAKGLGGFLNSAGDSVGKVFGSLLANQGGEVENPKLANVAPENRYPAKTHLPPHMNEVANIYHPHQGFGHTHEHEGFNNGHFYEGGTSVDQVKDEGGKIPGKAKYSGDNKKNDVVPAMLSKGEIVLPNSVTQSKNPINAAAQFVAAIEAKKGGNDEKAHRDFKEALSRAIKGRKKT